MNFLLGHIARNASVLAKTAFLVPLFVLGSQNSWGQSSWDQMPPLAVFDEGAIVEEVPAEMPPAVVEDAPALAPSSAPNSTLDAQRSGLCGELRIDATTVEICQTVNRKRAAMGAQQLRLDAGLSRVAQRFADDMRRRGYFSHVTPEGQTMGDRLRAGNVQFGWAGENIAQGQTSASEVMVDWMNSSGHRANILKREYRRIGIARSGNYWVQEFSD